MAFILRCSDDLTLPLPITKLIVCGTVYRAMKNQKYTIPVNIPLTLGTGTLVEETYHFDDVSEMDDVMTLTWITELIKRPIHHITVYRGKSLSSMGLIVSFYDRP